MASNLLVMKNKYFIWPILILFCLLICGNYNGAHAQSSIYGVVINPYDSLPIKNVKVVATGLHDFESETDNLGYYEIIVDTGNYSVQFTKVGYDTINIESVVIQSGSVEVNSSIYRYPYPVRNVSAVVSDDKQSCYVSWDLPKISYELILDDGELNTYKEWENVYGKVAVKFTPEKYPVVVKGGRLNVGDGSYPVGNYWLNDLMRVFIMDDDGIDGYPGTELASKHIFATNYYWVDFYDVFNIEVFEGSFYVCMEQLSNLNGSHPVGVDTITPFSNMSYFKKSYSSWERELDRDYLIRAQVDFYPDAGFNNEIEYYSISKVEFFEPCAYPQNATLTPIGISDTLNWTHNYTSGQPLSYYGYAISPNYYYGNSNWTYSNVVPPVGDIQVTVNITLCDSVNPVNTIVTMIGEDCKFNYYKFISDSIGVAIIDTLLDSYYDIFIDHIGYNIVVFDSVLINSDTIFSVELAQKVYPPRNLIIDSINNIASWDPPLITPLALETFEDTIFPPPGWQETHYTAPFGWGRYDHFNVEDFPVPPGDGYYALAQAGYGSSPTHPLDYLITPEVDLRDGDDFKLYFDSFFNGWYGQQAFVEYSYDNGVTWNLVEEMTPVGSWHNVEVDLSELSGNSGEVVRVAFHSDDNNSSASGWAIDNVSITGDTAEVIGYNISLNNFVIAQTESYETNYTFIDLTYGENYLACVNAIYVCGVSENICYEWGSEFLYKPLNLHDDNLLGSYNLNLKWTSPQVVNTDSIPKGLEQFYVYSSDYIIDSVLYTGQIAGDTINFSFDSLVPGTYYFKVTALYNLDLYGYPGEYAESGPSETDTIVMIWGSRLPFFEDWNSESFYENDWMLDDSAGNWVINTEKGNPEPVAEFYWEPEVQGGYSSSLTSSFLRADSLIEGTLLFEFDLRLRDRNETSEEKLKVELYNGEEWHQLEEFTNTGTYNYTRHSFNISDIAEGKIFQIRFTARGSNTRDIYGWYIDNIYVFRNCDSPEQLDGKIDFFTYDNPAIKINWEGPYDSGPLAEWIHWDDGIPFSKIGLTDGGTFSVAARWDASQLIDYDGSSISKIQYELDEGFTSVILKIWTGANAGTLVYEEDVTTGSVVGEWNEVTLTSPVTLNVFDELWVGYTVTHSAGTLPATTDDGPAIVGYGDMITLDGETWDPVSNFGLDYNWSLQFFLVGGAKGNTPSEISNNTVYNNKSIRLSNSDKVKPYLETNSLNNRYAIGFNIYRLTDGQIQYELYDFIEYIYGQTDYSYYDTTPNVNLQNGYSYKVTANWESDLDYCESAPALSKLYPTEDFVYVFLEDIEEQSIESALTIFPNPASDFITIESIIGIKSVRIFNLKGQIIYTYNYPTEMIIKISTTDLIQGLYLIRVETEGYVYSERIVIAR